MKHPYLAYAGRRLVQAVVVILLAYLLTFVVVSILPGDPVTTVLRDPQNGFTEDQIREIIAAQGLDQPIGEDADWQINDLQPSAGFGDFAQGLVLPG